MPETKNPFLTPRRKVDPGLIAALVVGCIAGVFVMQYASRVNPDRPVGELVGNVANGITVDEKPLHTLSATGDVRGIAFSSDGAKLFIGDREGLTLRDIATEKVLRTFDTEENGVHTLAISPNGGLIAVAIAYTGDIRLYPTDSMSDTIPTAMTLRDGGDQEQQSLAFSPDGNTLAGGGYDKTLRIWRADSIVAKGSGKVFDTTVGTGNTGKLLKQSVKLGDVVGNVTFSADGSTIAVATGPRVTLVDTATGKPGKIFYTDKQSATAIAFAPDGKTLAIGIADGNIALYDVATGRKSSTIKPATEGNSVGSKASINLSGSGQSVAALTYTQDGKYLVAALKSGVVQISDGATGKVKKLQADPENDRAAQALALSPDNKTTAVSYSDGTVRLWKL